MSVAEDDEEDEKVPFLSSSLSLYLALPLCLSLYLSLSLHPQVFLKLSLFKVQASDC